MLQKIGLSLASLLVFFSLQSQAQYLGLELGIRQQSASSPDGTVSSSMGYQFGGTGAVAIAEKVLFRSGFLYTQRPVTVATGGVNYDYHFNYLDVPLTLMWKFTDYGGIYAGVNLGLIVSADCDNCQTGAYPPPPTKSTITPFVIGGSFKFAPDFGVDVYYESVSKIIDRITSGTAVGANLLITFD